MKENQMISPPSPTKKYVHKVSVLSCIGTIKLCISDI